MGLFTKKDLEEKAKDAEIEVAPDASKSELEAALSGAPHPTQPSAGVEGRSTDGETSKPNSEQSSEGEFVKVFVVLGDFDAKDEELVANHARAVENFARQNGLTLTDTPSVKSVEKKGKSTEVTFTAPASRP